MEWSTLPDLVRVFLALAFIVALMGGLAFVMKRLGLSDIPTAPKGEKKRLKLVESLVLDRSRRLVIIQRDDKQHLVILGPNSETVIEQNIKTAKSKKDE